MAIALGMENHFTRFFRHHRYSDADLSIRLAVTCIDDDSIFREEGEELTALPVHLVVLTQSPYFESQVNFLEQQQQQECRSRSTSRTETSGSCRSRSRDSVGSKRRRGNEDEQGTLARTRRGSNNNHSNCRPKVVLTVQHREHEVAAAAVIASLYGVTDALSSLQQPELVHAIHYADLLQVGSATADALQLLQTAAKANAGLPTETLEKLAALSSWPSCLLPLLPDIVKDLSSFSNSPNGANSISSRRRQSHIQTVLLTVLGDLEVTWQQEELKDLLLGLPLPAMSMLLSSDKLTVYSEDTVLYTACKFVAAQATVIQQLVAVKYLSPLVRVGQLSDFQIMLQSTSNDLLEAGDVLKSHTSDVQRLFSLKRLGLSTAEVLAEVRHLLPTAPSSWSSGPRQVVALPSEGIKLVWEVPVCDLTAAVLRCFETKRRQDISSKASPPLAGLEWKIEVCCCYDIAGSCVEIGVNMQASSPSGFKKAFYRFDFRLQVPCNESLGGAGTTMPVVDSEQSWGWPNFFGLTMSDGWNEVAWAAMGLPTVGSFTVILTVSKVY